MSRSVLSLNVAIRSFPHADQERDMISEEKEEEEEEEEENDSTDWDEPVVRSTNESVFDVLTATSPSARGCVARPFSGAERVIEVLGVLQSTMYPAASGTSHSFTVASAEVVKSEFGREGMNAMSETGPL